MRFIHVDRALARRECVHQIGQLSFYRPLAYISGEVTRTQTTTGEVRTLPFVDSDLRFMKGFYRGTDGRFHQGAFAFV